MKRYIASIEVNNKLETIVFETDGNQVEYLWKRYGMSTFIEYVDEVPLAAEIELEEV